MKKIIVFMFLLFMSTAQSAEKACENNIVEVNVKSGLSFTTTFIKFCDQHTAEEFADQVNSRPITSHKAARMTVKRFATVYAK